MSDHKPPRLRPLPRDVVENAASTGSPLGEPDLAMRLYDALAALPPTERAAAIVAFGLDEGAAGVAGHLELNAEDAEAVTRSALQLLRAALADVDLDEDAAFARIARRRRDPEAGRPRT